MSLQKLNKSEASDKTKQERLEREEYRQDKGELDSETLKERLKHHEDAVKNLKKEIESLKKDEKEDVKDVKSESDAASGKQKAAREKFLEMIRKKKDGDKKDSDTKSEKKEESKAAKTKKEWEKIDTKELKRDTPKQQKEHEKDAIKDDQSKIKKLQKGKPSEKKGIMIKDLKYDETFDKSRLANAARESVTMQVKDDNVLEVDIEEAAQKFFGGKKRSNLKDSDFLFPGNRSFPIVTPADVPDAVSNFGRMSGNMSYDEFKRKLVTFVKKKGAKFVAALPNTIKKEFDLADATQIAVFPDKYVDRKDVGTVFQDTRPINYEGYEIDDKIQEQMKKDRLKNPQLRSAEQRAEGLR
tara:strand:- start:1463 stop:2527 length:1065 start_codon:yes stop_codon:yes gene_type:complete